MELVVLESHPQTKFNNFLPDYKLLLELYAITQATCSYALSSLPK